MDNKQKKQAQREKERKQFVAVIILLVIVFCFLVLMHNRFQRKIDHRPSEFEEDIETYDGSLNRNISNPFGSE